MKSTEITQHHPLCCPRDKSDCPVFIVGAPRSGTMALWTALLQHPDLMPRVNKQAIKEPWFFDRLFNANSVDNPLQQQYISAMGQATHRFMIDTFGLKNGRYISGNPYDLLCLEQIAAILPGACFIVLTRHPQEVVWSMLHAALNEGRIEKRNLFFSEEDIRSATELWKKFATAQLRIQDSEFSNRCYFVRHEELTEHPELIIPKLLNFIDERPCDSVAKALQLGIINTSFPAKDVTSYTNHYLFSSIDSDSARRARYQENRNRIAANISFCHTVEMHASYEMKMLNFVTLAQSARESTEKIRTNIGREKTGDTLPNRLVVNSIPWMEEKHGSFITTSTVVTILANISKQQPGINLEIYSRRKMLNMEQPDDNTYPAIIQLKPGEEANLVVSVTFGQYPDDFSSKLRGRPGMYSATRVERVQESQSSHDDVV
jgi:hypothetical protein